jgi:hypothetical protein
MWKDDKTLGRLKQYCNEKSVNKVIVIDNDKKNRPVDEIFQHPKLELVCYGTNIYVNPAWNEGYYRSKADIMCLLNDDISVDMELFRHITNTDMTNIDLIGVHLKGTVDNYNITDHEDTTNELFRLKIDKSKPIGGQSYAFGVCMFIKRSSYQIIPSLYQIWFGDDYLVQRCENVYCLKTSMIKGEISKTIVSLKGNKAVNDRIELDRANAYKFNHFMNGKNWDIVKKPNNIFENEYQLAQKTPSDINENLHILYELAKECNHVTEMGVRTGVSTRAFLNTDATLVSYDIQMNPDVHKLFATAKSNGKKASYIKADVLKLEIEETDLLFIDTYHVYKQLKEELRIHADKARKYIAFHDTYTFGLVGEDGREKNGLLSAVIEFMLENPNWKFKTYKTNNNGLLVIERG